MTTGILPDQKLEKQIEKQMGCMTGFLHLFDRHQILTGKRLYSTKRLPASPAVDSSPQSEKSVGSPAFSKELQPQQQQTQPRLSPECKKPSPSPEIRSPAPEFVSPAETPVRMPSPLPVFDTKEGLRTPWKLREAPRLSLDSRATVDGKGSLYPREIRTNAAIFSATRCESFAVATNSEENDNQKRSPSVIARLMGLEALPDSGREPIKKAELRRSASESRVSRDLQYRYIDGNNFKPKQSEPLNSGTRDNAVVEDHRSKARTPDSMELCVRKPKPEQQRAPNGCFTASPWNNSQQQRKIFYDSQDFFPEPKQNGTLYGEIERRLKMRGIDEPEKDLETLKQILEALQLKGLLHSKKPMERVGNRNFVFDRKFSSEESPIVIMKPSRSQFLNNRIGRTGQESTSSNFRSRVGINRNPNLAMEPLPSGRARLNRPDIERNTQKDRRARNSKSPDPNENTAKSPSSLARRKPLSIETPKRGNDSMDQRRSSPINSPRISPRRGAGSDQTSKSPRNRKPMNDASPRERLTVQVDDDSSAISESSFSTSSQIDTERSKMEDYKEGRSLLERCDKLLHSIAEITATESELQPSPVSVLDSSFYKDESSPSPVMRRRCIDFKDPSMELEDEMWSPMISPIRMKFVDNSNNKSDDSDLLYVSEILRVSDCISEDTDVFLLLEKQQYKTSSKVSKIHRRLVFDTITEILERKRQLPPWKALSSTGGKPSFRQIWSEFRRIRERDSTEDLFEVICGALKKDMAGDSVQGWVDCPMETSEAVLDIERLIFKDLIAETINDLAASTGKNLLVPALRRTLVF
ncbi:protein of unknown function DUF4378 [Macleaya cordata]|uniref:DUF4378 domain-containing protein n=1 Tax=Macleaya cordata TaxID=56857 RepID=A0A200Q4G8_MACCD|nr:protein of unknown function DUF4378 [Macleaya cordata]